MDIKVIYSAVDHFRDTRKFKTLKGAQRFAQRMLGRTPEMGSYYAMSGDGIGKIEVEGASLHELFPALRVPQEEGGVLL